VAARAIKFYISIFTTYISILSFWIIKKKSIN
jgi:hypothetical protein